MFFCWSNNKNMFFVGAIESVSRRYTMRKFVIQSLSMSDDNSVKARLLKEIKRHPLGVDSVLKNRVNGLVVLESEGFDNSDTVIQRLREEIQILKEIKKTPRPTIRTSVSRF